METVCPCGCGTPINTESAEEKTRSSFTSIRELGRREVTVGDLRNFIQSGPIPRNAEFRIDHNGYSAILVAEWQA